MSATLTFLLIMIPGTFFLGLNDVLVRRLLRDGTRSGQLLVAFDFLTTAILLSIPLVFFGIPELKPGFFSAALITAVLNIFAMWGWYEAFRREEASLISPLRLITPPLVILTGYMVLRETPSALGVVGILTTIIGLWFLVSSEAAFRDVRLREVLRRPGVLLGIAGAISFAISFPFDKKAVVASSPLFAVVCIFAVLGLASAFMVYLRAFAAKAELPRLHFRKDWRFFILLIFSHSLASFLSYAALNYALAAYAASVKRLWSFWAVLLSGKFLKEQNISRKLLATLVMLAGIAVTVIFG